MRVIIPFLAENCLTMDMWTKGLLTYIMYITGTEIKVFLIKSILRSLWRCHNYPPSYVMTLQYLLVTSNLFFTSSSWKWWQELGLAAKVHWEWGLYIPININSDKTSFLLRNYTAFLTEQSKVGFKISDIDTKYETW